ncbi:MAG: hypothetical protein IT365_21045 [Candidatus Hydrogenedentes bacterium]|nr:hypothetical protein [Candidatus Hydrogenedentota bacterium]
MRHTMILGLTLVLGLAGCSGKWDPVTPPEGLDDTVAFGISLENSKSGIAAGIDLAPPGNQNGGPAGLLLQQADGEWSRVEVPNLSDDWALYSAEALDDGQAWLGGGSFVLDLSDMKSTKDQEEFKAALEADLAGVSDPAEIEARVAAFEEAVAADAEKLAVDKKKPLTGAVTLFRGPDGTIDIVDNSIATPVWSLSTQGPADGRFATPYGVSQLAGGAWSSEDLLADLPTVHDIVFLSEDEGWAVGSDGDGSEGGAVHWADSAWTAAALPDVEGNWELFSVSFPDAAHGWAVGQSADLATGLRRGVALACASGTWSELELPEVSESWYLQAVCFVSSREGWAAGHDITGKRGVLLHYSRGKWTEEPISVTDSADWTLTGLCLTDGKNGWAVGYDNTNAKLLLLKRTQAAPERR